MDYAATTTLFDTLVFSDSLPRRLDAVRTLRRIGWEAPQIIERAERIVKRMLEGTNKQRSALLEIILAPVRWLLELAAYALEMLHAIFAPLCILVASLL